MQPHSEQERHLGRGQLKKPAGSLEDEHLDFEQRKRSMRNSTLEGMAYSLMAGVGDAYLPAAAVLLGASNFYIGLLAALPQLFGAFLQLFSLSAIRLLKSRRALVAASSALHALSWLPIMAVLLWPNSLSLEVMLLFFTLGTGAVFLANPSWSSWLSDIVPENERAGFFANRNRLMQLVLFVSTFAAGLLLRELQLGYSANAAFAAVFAIPFLARLSTVYFHLKTSDVPYEVKLLQEIKMKHLFLLPAHRNELWFLVFIGLFNFSVLFASPFFTPYMLNGLRFDVGTLGLITAVGVLAKIAAFPYWARAIDRFGNRGVLVSTALMAPFVPLLWLFSKDPLMLCLFNVFSGFVWSGLDLASFNFALSMVGRELRPSFIAKYNIFSGVFNAAGALAGGLFLAQLGGFSLFGYSGILLVFLLSGIMRLAISLFFAPKLSSGREVENTMGERAMVFNLMAVYPTQGAVHHVLDGWNFTRKAVASTGSQGGRIIKAGLLATGELVQQGGRKIMSKVSRRKKL